MLKTVCSSSLSFYYSMGSFLLMILLFQIITGIFLSIYYVNDELVAFVSVDMMSYYSIIIFRWLHVFGASFFFLLLYLHMFRGMIFTSFKKVMVWNTGVIMFLLSMLSAFLGYTLPWGQMSFWATAVITSFISVIPYIGKMILTWILGSVLISNTGLKLFYTLHFLLPLVVFLLAVMHMLFFLHVFGSKEFIPKSISYSFYYYILKDILNIIIFIMLFFMLSVWAGFEPANFEAANTMVTPVHIKPEWYFLPFYAMLRAIPHKFSGVVVMVLAVLVYFILPLSLQMKKHKYNKYALMFTMMVVVLLGFIGGLPVLNVLNFYAVLLTLMYFSMILFYL